MNKTQTGLIAFSLLLSGCTATANKSNSAQATTAAPTPLAVSQPGYDAGLARRQSIENEACYVIEDDGYTPPEVPYDPSIEQNPRTLAMFQPNNPLNKQCYDRNTRPYTFVVDAHNHFRPFGGNAVPMTELTDYFERLGVLFLNVYGIGQTLPIHSGCEYYGDCPTIPVTPSMRNDFRNASNHLEYTPDNIRHTLSMTFPDLSQPHNIMKQIALLDEEYTGLFRWMGEVNLVKQALCPNGRIPTPIEAIPHWADFMDLLEKRGTPIAIHSDLGNNKENTKYLHLMDEVLKLYPNNKIVWVHMGLSKELTNIDPTAHIDLLKKRLRANPNLMLDLSWRVIYDSYFSKPEVEKLYVDFINEYSERFLPGSDFVASRKKTFDSYKVDVQITSLINKKLDDKAFRNIALGENYFRFLGLDYRAPQVCE